MSTSEETWYVEMAEAIKARDHAARNAAKWWAQVKECEQTIEYLRIQQQQPVTEPETQE